jgi:PilZ domain
VSPVLACRRTAPLWGAPLRGRWTSDPEAPPPGTKREMESGGAGGPGSHPGVEIRLVRLVDLSPEGVRIEHPEALNEGLVCSIDLPPDLGRIWLTGRVVWTKLHKAEQTPEGERRVDYHSGLTWTTLSPEQQSALAAALDKLRAATHLPPREPSP